MKEMGGEEEVHGLPVCSPATFRPGAGVAVQLAPAFSPVREQGWQDFALEQEDAC